jgi:ribosome-binding protein aMBF1 (putative translation factor)
MDSNVCELCGKYGPTDKHHVFGNAYRKKSERYGYVVRLCRACHTTGNDAVHVNKDRRNYLKRIAQKEYEQTHTREEFIREFGRNYLED